MDLHQPGSASAQLGGVDDGARHAHPKRKMSEMGEAAGPYHHPHAGSLHLGGDSNGGPMGDAMDDEEAELAYLTRGLAADGSEGGGGLNRQVPARHNQRPAACCHAARECSSRPSPLTHHLVA